MNQIVEPDVIASIIKGRKIDAIKQLRELRGIGLKEAKDLVDSYVSGNYGDDGAKSTVGKVSSGGVFIFNIMLVLVLIGLASYFLIKNFI